MEISETDRAYTAGLIDADECIYIGEANKGSHNYQIRVECKMTSIEPVKFLKNIWNGSFTSYQPKGNRKRVYSWTAQGKDAKKVLEEIRWYLKYKQNQAWLCLEFLEQKTISSGSTRISKKEIALRKGFKLALQNTR